VNASAAAVNASAAAVNESVDVVRIGDSSQRDGMAACVISARQDR
jgi:hypothetical protein